MKSPPPCCGAGGLFLISGFGFLSLSLSLSLSLLTTLLDGGGAGLLFRLGLFPPSKHLFTWFSISEGAKELPHMGQPTPSYVGL